MKMAQTTGLLRTHGVPPGEIMAFSRLKEELICVASQTAIHTLRMCSMYLNPKSTLSQ